MLILYLLKYSLLKLTNKDHIGLFVKLVRIAIKAFTFIFSSSDSADSVPVSGLLL